MNPLLVKWPMILRYSSYDHSALFSRQHLSKNMSLPFFFTIVVILRLQRDLKSVWLVFLASM